MIIKNVATCALFRCPDHLVVKATTSAFGDLSSEFGGSAKTGACCGAHTLSLLKVLVRNALLCAVCPKLVIGFTADRLVALS